MPSGRARGLDGLRSAGPTGHAPRLSEAQLDAVRQALRQGARVHGFDTDHWTLVRIARVIEQQTRVAYHPGHVWKLLRRRLGWRLQRPARRAIERDEQAIARWVETDLAADPATTPADLARSSSCGTSRGARCCR
jgi:transposase